MGGKEDHVCLGVLRVENRRKDIPGRGNSLCKAESVTKVGLLDARKKLGVARSCTVAHYRKLSHPHLRGREL